jgi:hypothetical protein
MSDSYARADKDERQGDAEFEAGYRMMTADAEHEEEALEWIEALVGDISGEDSEPQVASDH